MYDKLPRKFQKMNPSHFCLLKCCDSDFDVKCSKFTSCYKCNNYLALDNMYQWIAFENYNINDQQFNRHDFR